MRGLVLAAAVVALGGGAAAAAPTKEEEAVKAFLRAYADRDANVRKKAVGLLEAVEGARATEALLPALGDPSPRVRERAREAVSLRTTDGDLEAIARAGLRNAAQEVRRRSAEALGAAGERARPRSEALAASLRDRDPIVREAAAAALGATGHRGQASVVAAAIKKEESPEVRGALLQALGLLDGKAAVDEAARLAARDREGPPAVAALRVLGRLDPGGAGRAAAGLVRHPCWEVRVAAAEALGSHGSDAAAVQALLDGLLKEKRLRGRQAIAAGLERITGAPLGDDPDRWKEWWGKHREGWEPAKDPGVSPPPRPSGEEESVARFYDIPVDGDRVVFAMDTSKSILDPARLGESATKMQLAVAEAAKTLAGIREEVSFNLVAFGTEVEAWRPRAVPANSSTKYEALRFLQKRPPEGRTNIFDALAAAMADREVDTVFLLTDGAPTEGQETTRTGFLRGLAHLRRWRPVRVHCVEVGAGNTGTRWKGFLAEVAAACGGARVAR